ncbi:MAG: hypothetical protein R3C05_16160 [Pirellulaceae bacterium]
MNDAIVQWLNPRAEPLPDDSRIYVSPDWNDQDLLIGFLNDDTILVSSDPGFVFNAIQRSKSPAKVTHALASAMADMDPNADFARRRYGPILDTSQTPYLSSSVQPQSNRSYPTRSLT